MSAPTSATSRSQSWPSPASSLKGGAVDQLADQVGPAILLAELVERDDAAVVEPGRGLGLAQDPGPGLGAGIDHLDRDVALEPAVPGAVDGAEAAAAEPLLDPETIEYQEPITAPSASTPGAAGLPDPRKNDTDPERLPAAGPPQRSYLPPSRLPRRLSLDPFDEESSASSTSEQALPRRTPRERRPRRPRRQQVMARRGIALGAGLIVLILLVLGIRGCLDARKDRALTDYARDVSQIVDETAQTSERFFARLEDPGTASVTDFVTEINADRSAMDAYLTRVEKPRRAGRHEQRPGRARAGLPAAGRCLRRDRRHR